MDTDIRFKKMGGVRTPYVDMPIATHPVSGNAMPFTYELLKQLYPNHGSYVNQVIRETNDVRKDRWVLDTDAQAIKSEAAHAAVSR